MFNDANTVAQPTCKDCRCTSVLAPLPDIPLSSGSAFPTSPSQGPASSQFLSADSVEVTQRVSYGRAARGVPNPGASQRQLQANIDGLHVPDPVLDLNSDTWQDDPALTNRNWELLQGFHEKLDSEQLETCSQCNERWFRMGLNDDIICSGCIKADHGLDDDMPFLYSAENNLDPGPQEQDLEPLMQIEEMLIARGHVVNFLTNTAKVYNQLPLLPQDLNVILVRPVNWHKDPRMQRQSCKDTCVRKNVIKKWLEFIRRNHPGYRNIKIAHENLEALGDDFFADDKLIVHEVEAETQIDATAIGPDYIEKDPEVAAVPDLHPDRNEIDLIQEQLQSQGATRRQTIGRHPCQPRCSMTL
ncbi:hypothetical protein EJ02DRAFT_422920 [Clathrospora elynae]|uniref:DUF6570 domain-containing protein n=1 Tax=Clathrospora elynae TaxID=706981 RepID=A0A6A5SNA3_9PLEO|nr:hypothetical protein EJ02DRAFT_422920 [Clathrospora elynae]